MSLLGQLTVGIIGSMGGFSDTMTQAQKETEKFAKGVQNIGKDISTFGYAFQDLGQGLTNKITKPAIAATTAIAGIVGTLGFKRLVGIDTAQAKLKGLGHDAESVEVIMESALASVKGTAYGLGEAATTAASAVAAGVHPGQELTKYLTLAGDAAAIAGTGMDEMGSIFNKVTTSNKAYNNELQQLSDRGIPIYQYLAEVAGVAEEAVFEMASEGQISSDMFLKAIDKNIGGAAGIMGAESFTAGVANVGAAMGRIGASFLDAGGEAGGFFSQLKPLMANFIESIDDFGDKAANLGVKFGQAFTGMIEKVKSIKQWFGDLSAPIQDIIKKVALFGSIGAVAIGPILLIFGKFIVTIGNIVTRFGVLTSAISKLSVGVKGFGAVIGFITSPIGIAIAAIAGLAIAGVLLYKNWETVKERLQVAFQAFQPLFETLKGSFQNLMDSLGPIWESLKTLFDSLKPILTAVAALVGGVLVSAFGLIISSFSAALSAIGPLINAVINLVDIVVNMVNVIVALFTGDFAGAFKYLEAVGESTKDFFINIFDAIVNYVTTFVQTVIDFFHGLYMTLVGNSIIPDMVNAIVDWFKNMFKWVIDLVVKIVTDVVKWFTDLSNKVKLIFTTIQTVFKTIWTAISNTFKSIVTSIFNTAKSIFTNISNTIKSILDGVKSTITSVWNSIKDTISTVVNSIKSTISTIFNSLSGIVRSAMTSVSTAVKDGITTAYNTVIDFASNFYDAGRNIVTSIADGIRSAVSSVTSAIGSVASQIRDYLPFSPAKEGPLKDLNKLDFGGPISDSIRRAMPSVNAMLNELVALPTASSLSSIIGNPSYDIKLNGMQERELDYVGRGDIIQHITINSPEPTSPSDNARKMKQAAQQLALEW